MKTFIGSFFLPPSSGEGSVHADRLHLSAWLCDHGLSRHAHGVARSSSSHLLLAHLHASRLSRVQDLGRDGPVDTRHPHRLALWTLAQSRLLERTSPRALVGAGSLGHLASTGERHPAPLWRWQPRRQTRHEESCGPERAYKPASSLVFWPALRAGDGGVGWLSCACGFSAHSAQTSCGVSQRKCLVSRDGGGVCPTELGNAGHCGRGCCLWLQSEYAHGPRPGQGRYRTPLGLCLCNRPDLEDRGGEIAQNPCDPYGRVDAESSGMHLPKTLGERADELGTEIGPWVGRAPSER